MSFKYIKDPDKNEIGDTIEEFLAWLSGPTWLELTGNISTETRAFSTLLHGNESSGVIAVYKLLKESFKPKFTTHILIVNVRSARTLPLFTHRTLAGEKDLNRCFKPPFDGNEGKITYELMRIINKINPRYMIDIHNTSGDGPAFGVSVRDCEIHKSLVSHFSNTHIVTDIEMGSLMELDSESTPIVTIECGGTGNTVSDKVAYDGIFSYLTQTQFNHKEITVFHHPIRIELVDGACVAFEDSVHAAVELTLLSDIEKYNFGKIEKNVVLGWGVNKPSDFIRAIEPKSGENKINSIFYLDENRLKTKIPLYLFMITTNTDIAQSDCLFYAVEA